MITIEKQRAVTKAVSDFLHIIKFGSGIIRLETKLELKVNRIFQNQEKEFWRLEAKGNWLNKCYVKAQKDLAIKKMRMSENPTDRINFIANLTEEWHEDISDDVILEKTLKKSYVSGYNFAGQEVLNNFKIQESFGLRNLDVLSALDKRSKIVATQINDVSWDLVNNKIADSFWKEGKNVDKVARDLKGLYAETYKHRALNIARTETGEIVSEAQFVSHQKMGIPELEWLAEPDACRFCSPLKGNVVKLGENFDNGLGWKGKHPLVHNRCRCDTAPKVPKEYVPSTYWTGD